MNAQYLSILSVFSLTTPASAQVAHFDMSLSEGKITELVSAVQATVESQLPAFNVDGLEGKALRFDGYSNYVQATVPVSTFSEDALTATVLLAPETYPMMNADEAELSPTFGLICGNLDETAKTGIALELSSQGEIRFRFASANGFIYTIPSTQRLPLNKWSRITAVLDKTANLATLYMDAQIVGTTKMSRLGIKLGNNQFLIGKSSKQLTLDFTSLKRYVNDHIYGGKYQITLPEKPLQGEKLKIDLFLDGSIVDIFVADKWAFSVRLFPTDAAAIEAEAFADSHTQCTIRAWNIEPDQASTSTHQVAASESRHSGSQAYKLNGQICKDNQKGLVINRGKIYVRN